MTNDLKERLDALSAEAAGSPLYTPKSLFGPYSYANIYSGASKSIFAERMGQKDAKFVCDLINAYRSGDLITRQELEEAVAAEREGCLNAVEECAYTPDNDIEEAFVDGVSASEEAIRARSEQKGGA